MRTLLHHKSISCFLLVVMLTVTINCVHESAHAMQCHVIAACSHAGHADSSAPHQDQDSPTHEHQEHDCCDSCSSCASHAPLTRQALQLVYNPVITDQQLVEPFHFLPEVYLSKFVPPQIAC